MTAPVKDGDTGDEEAEGVGLAFKPLLTALIILTCFKGILKPSRLATAGYTSLSQAAR